MSVALNYKIDDQFDIPDDELHQALAELSPSWLARSSVPFQETIIAPANSISRHIISRWPDKVGPAGSLVTVSHHIEAQTGLLDLPSHDRHIGLVLADGTAGVFAESDPLVGYDFEQVSLLHANDDWGRSDPALLLVGAAALDDDEIEEYLRLQQKEAEAPLSEAVLDELSKELLQWQKELAYMKASLQASLMQGGDPAALGDMLRALSGLMAQSRVLGSVTSLARRQPNDTQHRVDARKQTNVMRGMLEKLVQNGKLPPDVHGKLLGMLNRLRSITDKPSLAQAKLMKVVRAKVIAKKTADAKTGAPALKGDTKSKITVIGKKAEAKAKVDPKTQRQPAKTVLKADAKEKPQVGSAASLRQISPAKVSLSRNELLKGFRAATSATVIRLPVSRVGIINAAISGKAAKAEGKAEVVTLSLKGDQKATILPAKQVTANSLVISKDAIKPIAKAGMASVFKNASLVGVPLPRTAMPTKGVVISLNVARLAARDIPPSRVAAAGLSRGQVVTMPHRTVHAAKFESRSTYASFVRPLAVNPTAGNSFFERAFAGTRTQAFRSSPSANPETFAARNTGTPFRAAPQSSIHEGEKVAPKGGEFTGSKPQPFVSPADPARNPPPEHRPTPEPNLRTRETPQPPVNDPAIKPPPPPPPNPDNRANPNPPPQPAPAHDANPQPQPAPQPPPVPPVTPTDGPKEVPPIQPNPVPPPETLKPQEQTPVTDNTGANGDTQQGRDNNSVMPDKTDLMGELKLAENNPRQDFHGAGCACCDPPNKGGDPSDYSKQQTHSETQTSTLTDILSDQNKGYKAHTISTDSGNESTFQVISQNNARVVAADDLLNDLESTLLATPDPPLCRDTGRVNCHCGDDHQPKPK